MSYQKLSLFLKKNLKVINSKIRLHGYIHYLEFSIKGLIYITSITLVFMSF